jgi:O-antigen/teichoic acid export membrane protein
MITKIKDFFKLRIIAFISDWYYGLSNVLKYFLLAIIFFGSAGVWIPLLIAWLRDMDFDIQSMPVSITTFYISIFFAGCMESILTRIDEAATNLKSHILDMLSLIFGAIILVFSTLWMNAGGALVAPLLMSVFGTVLALKLWWKNNRNKPTFNEIIRTEADENHGNNWGDE